MFTLAQINAIHDQLGSANTLFEYVCALNAIGVEKVDSYVTDGHSEYFGTHGHKVSSPPAHNPLTVAKTSNRESFLRHLTLHDQGKTTYIEMSEELAASGIEKWTVDINKATMTFYDTAGNEMRSEAIQ